MKLNSTIAVLVLGRAEDAHFAATVQWLAANMPCRFVSDARTALDNNSGDVQPTLVILLQSRPGEFMDAELSALRNRWPLAGFVAIAGSWCEGEPRSGFVAGGIYRIPWHVALFRLTSELSPFIKGAPIPGVGLFGLPATATSDERLLATSRFAAQSPAVIAIAAIRASIAEPIIEALGAAGHTAIYWQLEGGAIVRGLDAVIWHTFGCEQRLGRYRGVLPVEANLKPLIALADFPRPQDLASLSELGVDRVLGSPLMIADLLACLDELLADGSVLRLRKTAVA